MFKRTCKRVRYVGRTCAVGAFICGATDLYIAESSIARFGAVALGAACVSILVSLARLEKAYWTNRSEW